MSNTSHIPMRMCAVTREKLPKKELLRFVCTVDNDLVLDKGDRVRGRGLNIKPEIEIFDLAVKRKLFERVLGAKEVNYESLKTEVQEYIDLRFREKVVVRVSKEQLDKISSK